MRRRYTVFAPTHSELDFLSIEAVDAFFKTHTIGIIIHCAFIGGNRKTPYMPDAVEKNLRMFTNLVRYAKSVRKVIHIGSGAEYDIRYPVQRVTEASFGERIPADQYGFAKYLCSRLAQDIDNVIVLRPFGVWGKYEDYETRFMSNAICKTLYDLPITLNQNAYFDYLFIDDFVKIVEFFMLHDVRYKYYNVGSGERIDLLTIAKKVAALDHKKPASVIVKQGGLKQEYTPNIDRLRKEIGILPHTPFNSALRQLYHWYAVRKSSIEKERLLKDV